MPCARSGCKDAFQAKKGIKCEKCEALFHRKCVKKPKHALEFLCSNCVYSADVNSMSNDTSLCDTSFLDFSDYEERIAQLEEEVKSLRLIVSLKDQEIEELKEKTAEIEQKSTGKDQSADDTKWKTVTKQSSQLPRRRYSDAVTNSWAEIPTTNRFQPLQNPTDEERSLHEVNNIQQDQPKQGRKRQKKTKVLLLADSNGRYCSDKLRNGLGEDFEVCTIFKPSAKINQVIENVDHLTKDFTQQDVVIIHAGSNDLPLEDQETNLNISHGMQIIKDLSFRKKVIVNSIPARFDNFMLNQKVKTVNNLIEQSLDVGINKNIVVNNHTERMSKNLYARDGLHFNRGGKINCVKGYVQW